MSEPETSLDAVVRLLDLVTRLTAIEAALVNIQQALVTLQMQQQPSAQPNVWSPAPNTVTYSPYVYGTTTGGFLSPPAQP